MGGCLLTAASQPDTVSALLQCSFPITAAGQSWIGTRFPFQRCRQRTLELTGYHGDFEATSIFPTEIFNY